MTRPIDRGHEARARAASTSRRIDWTLEIPVEKAGDALRAALGIPADLQIGFGKGPDATDDATFEIADTEDRA